MRRRFRARKRRPRGETRCDSEGKRESRDRRNARLSAGAAFDALARRAEAALVFERIWPPLAWAGALVALFLAASSFGLWFAAPRFGRIAGVALFAALLLAALAPLARLQRPKREETLARLDRDARLPHRPAASLADRLAMPGDGATTNALWTLHRRRLARQVAGIAPAFPSPRMAWRDPRALRFCAVLLALGAAIVAGPERYGRVAAAFDWRGGSAPAAAARLDAWIDPPAYTGAPPMLLDVSPSQITAQKLVAPEGSNSRRARRGERDRDPSRGRADAARERPSRGRGESADRTPLDRSRRRRVHARAQRLAVRRLRHRGDRRRQADDHADRSAARRI